MPEHNKPVLPEEVDFSQGSNTRVKDAFRRTRDMIKTHKQYERSSIGNSSISNSIVPGKNVIESRAGTPMMNPQLPRNALEAGS